MSSKSTCYRKKLKEEDPEGYVKYLERQRLRGQKRRAEEKRRWEEEPHTRAQEEIHEAKRRKHNERALASYHKKRAEQERQTRSSQTAKTPRTPGEKRPKDMTSDEKRVYNAMMRKRQRDARSSQKKTADKMRHRREYKAKREAETKLKLPKASASKESRLPQKAYNLNHEFKSKTKQLNFSSEEYARTALNLLNPKTPEKRAAIAAAQERHPCRVLFLEPDGQDVERELGIDVLDEDIMMDTEVIPGSKTTHDLVQAISRMLPHARYSTKHGAARVMEMTVKDAFAHFHLLHPDMQVGLTLFQQLRPKNVRLLGSVPVESCLCIYCTNVRLKIKALNKLLGGSGRLPDEMKLLNFINCPTNNRWNDISCIDGKCMACNDRIRPLKIFCRDILGIDEVSWLRWLRTENGRMEPVNKSGSIIDLLEEFKIDLVEPSRGISFSQHLFTAYWQHDQFKSNRRNPQDGELVMVQDFAENRKAVYASEIKSAHFGKGQITVHPMVCFYRKGDEVMRHSIVILSDDIGHDHHAVNSFTLAAVSLLKKQASFTKLTMWSDGAASQYKGRGTFADLSLMTGLDVQRCFFGSEHGKGEADGETGVLSQQLRRAVGAGHSFSNAQQMFAFLRQHHSLDKPSSKRQYILLNEIDRERPEVETQSIPGTRSYHQFRRVAPYIVQARRLACFCTGCINGDSTSCLNRKYVGEYVTHKLKPSAQTVLNQAFLTEADPDPSQEQAQPSCSDEEVKIGDYLEITCEINRLQKKFFAVVIPSPVATSDFYVRFFKRATGQAFVFGDVPDEGLIYKGPPDNYKWRLIPSRNVAIDNRGHYFFKC